MKVTEFYSTEPTGSQAYGAARDGGKRSHTGDDFSHSTRPDTVPVPAIRAGVVQSIQYDRPNLSNGYGNQVFIRHDDGSTFSYGHLGRVSVTVGQDVTAGTVIGTEGTTGWTDGPCVHIEFFDGGRRVDPYPHIRAALAALPASIPTEKETDMLMFFDNAQRILWANGFFNTYDESVYHALKHYSETGSEQPGTEGTVVREVWAANNFMATRTAQAAALATTEALRASGIPVSADVNEEEIAARVVAMLPTTFVVSAS